MTPSTTPPTDPIPPTDDELEARLHGSWDRSVAKAEDDLARTDLVAVALAGGRSRSARRSAGVALLGVAALLLVGAALIVGGGGRRDDVRPSPIANLGTPAPSAGSPAPSGGSQDPVGTANPDEGSFIPYLDPSESFPPTVDGQPVVAVGPAADARIAAATDDSPIYLSGWLLGTDRTGCAADFDYGSPAPNGVLFKACAATPVRETQDGGAGLPVHWSWAQLNAPGALPRWPAGSKVVPVLVEVHAHDPGCASPDCATTLVLDRVIAYGAARVAKPLLAMTPPPGGLSVAQAIAAAQAQEAVGDFGEPMVVQSVEAGPGVLLGGDRQMDLTWYWFVHLVSDDGFRTYTVSVNYLDGTVTGSEGRSVQLP